MNRHQILILGPGCAKCGELAASTAAIADELGLTYDLEKVTDIMRFADYGVMVTPALVLDGEVVVSGKVPSADELRHLLQPAN